MRYIIASLALLILATVASAITLEWDAPTEGIPDNYNMYRVVVPGGICAPAPVQNFELLGSVPATQRTFADSAPVIGANYYHVTASNAGGESLPSNQVCFQAVQRPTSPQNLRLR